jgi:hypothetical protein
MTEMSSEACVSRSPGMRSLVLAAAIIVLALPAMADDKSPPPSITVDNCAKVQTEIQKVDRPNGTIWLQSVTCSGDAEAPKVREQCVAGVLCGGGWEGPLTTCCPRMWTPGSTIAH